MPQLTQGYSRLLLAAAEPQVVLLHCSPAAWMHWLLHHQQLRLAACSCTCRHQPCWLSQLIACSQLTFIALRLAVCAVVVAVPLRACECLQQQEVVLR